MQPREVIDDPAAVLALAERVCPSLNGPASFRLAAALELIDAGADVGGALGFEDYAAAIGALDPERVCHWAGAIERSDAHVVTVVDDAYPTNLRMVHDRPPFLFVSGDLVDTDERAVAVVGTRKPSEEGLAAAGRIAAQLANRAVTVVSGLAEGIDAAAHLGAMDAGGRTLAVFGTGIERVYPSSNRALAKRIASAGATLSQFWPAMAGTRWSFPVRNIVTSGLSLGTVVVEAGPTSGARQQAEHAVRHGKRLFLLRRLVEAQPWARALVDAPGVAAIDDVDEVVVAVERALHLDESMV